MKSVVANSQRQFPIRGLLIGVMILILGGLFAVPYFLASMIISGEEFSPQLFQKRNFFYYRIPGTKIRLGATTLSPAASPSSKPVLTHLVSSATVDWQVARASQGANQIDLGPEILLSYLSATNVDGAILWDDWSFRKPGHAAILWPIVQEVAVHELYFCVPSLFRIADAESNLVALRRKLRFCAAQAAQTKLKSMSLETNSSTRNELKEWALTKIEEYQEDSEFQSLQTAIRE